MNQTALSVCQAALRQERKDTALLRDEVRRLTQANKNHKTLLAATWRDGIMVGVVSTVVLSGAGVVVAYLVAIVQGAMW